VMPNQLTQGDRFTAGFSVLNRADKARDLTVTLQATGAIAGDKQSTKQTVHLEPFQRDTVWMPLDGISVMPCDFSSAGVSARGAQPCEFSPCSLPFVAS